MIELDRKRKRKRFSFVVGVVCGYVGGCAPEAPPPPPPPTPYVYPPAPIDWTGLAPVLRVGRGQPVTTTPPVGIAGGERDMLRLPTVWQVPGSPARALIYGTIDGEAAVELIDIDRGVLLWRDRKNCAGPIVGVTATRAVCADAKGTRAIELAKAALDWETTEPFVAIDGDRVAIAGVGAVTIRTVEGGDDVAHVELPPGVLGTSVLATCSAHEVFAADPDNRVQRIVDAPPAAKTKTVIAWTAPAPSFTKLDACGAGPVLIATRGKLTAVARDTGKPTGSIDGVLGSWPARDGSDRIEVATALGVASYARDLAGPPVWTALPPLGELLASRGALRLIRATPMTAALVDPLGVRAYLPFGELGGALGDTAIVAASWQGAPSETVHRRLVPPPAASRPTATPPLPARTPLALAAELRDLPDVTALDEQAAFAHPGGAHLAVPSIAIDPADPRALYAVALEREPDDTSGGGVARADLAARAWRWQRADGCGNGAPVAIAIARTVIACGAATSRRGGATVRATTRDGAAAWEWRGDAIDAIAGGGDLIAIAAGDRTTLLDARDGRAIGELASDDGLAVRAAIVQRGAETWLASYARGAIALRLPLAGMLPLATIEIAGVVRAVSPSDGGVLVELEDGDAYRIDLRGPRAIAIPGLGLGFRASGELVTGEGPGGPLYAPRPPVPAPVRPAIPVAPYVPGGAPMEAAPLSTPIPPPPTIGSAWQSTLFALDGGVVARNDYALAPPIVPVEVRSPRAPFVVMSGEAGSRVAIVLDPHTGDPLRRVRVPDAAPAFSTIVDGKPIVGIVAAAPLRIVTF